MRTSLKACVVGLALSATTGTVWAAEVCARAPDLTALQVAALQQELMVAALTCQDVALYNNFVTTYQQDLIKSDQTLKAFFEGFGEGGGNSQYHAFKTKMANLYSIRSAADKNHFCTAVRATFKPALTGEKKNLASFALAQPIAVNEPYTNCGESVAGGAMRSQPEVVPTKIEAPVTARNTAPPVVEGRPLAAGLAASAAAPKPEVAAPATETPPMVAAAEPEPYVANTPEPKPDVQAQTPPPTPPTTSTDQPPTTTPRQTAPNRDLYANRNNAYRAPVPNPYRPRTAPPRPDPRYADPRYAYNYPYDTRGMFWPADPYWNYCYTRTGARLPCSLAAERYRSNQYYYDQTPYQRRVYPPGWR